MSQWDFMSPRSMGVHWQAPDAHAAPPTMGLGEFLMHYKNFQQQQAERKQFMDRNGGVMPGVATQESALAYQDQQRKQAKAAEDEHYNRTWSANNPQGPVYQQTMAGVEAEKARGREYDMSAWEKGDPNSPHNLAESAARARDLAHQHLLEVQLQAEQNPKSPVNQERLARAKEALAIANLHSQQAEMLKDPNSPQNKQAQAALEGEQSRAAQGFFPMRQQQVQQIEQGFQRDKKGKEFFNTQSNATHVQVARAKLNTALMSHKPEEWSAALAEYQKALQTPAAAVGGAGGEGGAGGSGIIPTTPQIQPQDQYQAKRQQQLANPQTRARAAAMPEYVGRGTGRAALESSSDFIDQVVTTPFGAFGTLGGLFMDPKETGPQRERLEAASRDPNSRPLLESMNANTAVAMDNAARAKQAILEAIQRILIGNQ